MFVYTLSGNIETFVNTNNDFFIKKVINDASREARDKYNLAYNKILRLNDELYMPDLGHVSLMNKNVDIENEIVNITNNLKRLNIEIAENDFYKYEPVYKINFTEFKSLLNKISEYLIEFNDGKIESYKMRTNDIKIKNVKLMIDKLFTLINGDITISDKIIAEQILNKLKVLLDTLMILRIELLKQCKLKQCKRYKTTTHDGFYNLY